MSVSVADAADCSLNKIHLQTSDYVNSGKLSQPKWGYLSWALLNMKQLQGGVN